MTLTLSISALRRHRACDLPDRIDDLRRVIPDVADDQPVPLRVWWDLPTTSIPDRWWSLRAAEPAMDARRLGVRAAALAARRALPDVRQDGGACASAIEAAEAWAEEPTPERAQACRLAANAANAAAYAAAYAAANAAAYAAANAAANAERDAQRLDLDRLLEAL